MTSTAENTRQKSLADVRNYVQAADELKDKVEAARQAWWNFMDTDPRKTKEMRDAMEESRALFKLKKVTHDQMIRWGELAVLAQSFKLDMDEWHKERERLETELENLREQLYLRDRKK